jgi:predicted nucleotide-binding protein
LVQLGFFAARLGRGRVAVIYEEGVELPSDAGGIAYVSAANERWKLSLGIELRDAGFAVDLNKV